MKSIDLTSPVSCSTVIIWHLKMTPQNADNRQWQYYCHNRTMTLLNADKRRISEELYLLQGPPTLNSAPPIWKPDQLSSPKASPPSTIRLARNLKMQRFFFFKIKSIVNLSAIPFSPTNTDTNTQTQPVRNSFLPKVICKLFSMPGACLLHFWGKCTQACQPGWKGVI